MNKWVFMAAAISVMTNAELRQIDDISLAEINGQGSSAITAIMDDVYINGEDAKLTLDFDSEIPLVFSNFYWVGHDSDIRGDKVYGGTVGSRDDPFFINTQEESVTLKDGEILEATSVVFAFPEGRYKGNNPDAGKMDLGTLMTLEHASGNTDETWLVFDGMDLDGTYVKFWAPQGGGLAMSGELNFSADELLFQTATVNGAPSDNLNTAWKISDFDLYLPLGNTLYQPVTLNTDDDQQLVFEIAAINENTAPEFYTAPTGNLSAENITINNWNSGKSYIEDIQLQHLRVSTHDLN